MCNSCVQRVQTVSKSRGHEHNLCAATTPTRSTHGQNRQYSTSSTHRNTTPFSTQISARLYLLKKVLSTIYTGPITNTPN
jgi:hypothetical protein